MNEAFSFNPSANLFVFIDFNIHHKDWLTYSCGTDRPVNSIINNFTQTVNFPTRILDYDSCSPALFYLFISSDASTFSTICFFSTKSSNHVVVSVSIDFPTNSKPNAPFHRIAYDYSRADRNGLHDRLRDIPWEDIFKISAPAAASECSE